MSAFAILALAAAAAAAPASTYTFTPTNTAFTATGTMNLTKAARPLACALVLKGRVNAKGVAKITAAKISPGDLSCKNILASGLPWLAKASGAGKGAIKGLTIVGRTSGSCGPGKVKIRVSGGGAWTANATALVPDCEFSASLATSPAITIAP